MARKKKSETEQADLGLTQEVVAPEVQAEPVAVAEVAPADPPREDEFVDAWGVPAKNPGLRKSAKPFILATRRWEVWVRCKGVSVRFERHSSRERAERHAEIVRRHWPDPAVVEVVHRPLSE